MPSQRTSSNQESMSSRRATELVGPRDAALDPFKIRARIEKEAFRSLNKVWILMRESKELRKHSLHYACWLKVRSEGTWYVHSTLVYIKRISLEYVHTLLSILIQSRRFRLPIKWPHGVLV